LHHVQVIGDGPMLDHQALIAETDDVSLLAHSKNAACSASGISSDPASARARARDGRLVPASSLRTVLAATANRSASASCVRSSCLRRCFSQAVNGCVTLHLSTCAYSLS
jgi:hypothetical protein